MMGGTPSASESVVTSCLSGFGAKGPTHKIPEINFLGKLLGKKIQIPLLNLYFPFCKVGIFLLHLIHYPHGIYKNT